MKTELSDAQITMGFRIILLLGFMTIIGSIMSQETKFKALATEYDTYRRSNEMVVLNLESSLELATAQAKKSIFVQSETECLAKNIYFEARNESYAGKMAVATVTKNRVQNKGYPKTFCGVVYQPCQFSWTCDSRKDTISNTSEYKESKKIAEDVLLMGKRSSIIDRSVMFYHANYIKPYWANSRQFVTQIGSHIFYR